MLKMLFSFLFLLSRDKLEKYATFVVRHQERLTSSRPVVPAVIRPSLGGEPSGKNHSYQGVLY
ncbi:hypothetical protein [Proteiniphilum sp.]|uniref:hypothetical protein n=1 Tax=Proteiniphilum sp. TaxID=1926877 RepID=UPI00331C03A8